MCRSTWSPSDMGRTKTFFIQNTPHFLIGENKNMVPKRQQKSAATFKKYGSRLSGHDMFLLYSV